MRHQQLWLTVVSGLTACVIAVPAWAVMSAPSGWYLEGNVGSTSESGKTYPSGSSTSGSGIGGNLNLGYKFMPYVTAEIGYTQYANTSVKNSATNSKAGSDKHYSYDIAMKGIAPFSDSGFEVFAKLGAVRNVSSMSITDSTQATAIGLSSGQHSTSSYYISLGGEYYFTPELAAVAQWASANGNSSTGTMALTSIGLSYIFG